LVPVLKLLAFEILGPNRARNQPQQHAARRLFQHYFLSLDQIYKQFRLHPPCGEGPNEHGRPNVARAQCGSRSRSDRGGVRTSI
jgi:hypothetical protein